MAMFGKKKDEPVVQPVPWTGGHWFVVGDVARPAAFRRKALTGPRAVRMPNTQEGVRYYAPVALVTQAPGGDEESASYELYDATEPDALLCTLSPEKGGARYRVTDAQGEELGLVRRTPAPKRTIQHGWWLQQPGHPDIVARYHWAKGSAKDIATRGKETAVRGAGAPQLRRGGRRPGEPVPHAQAGDLAGGGRGGDRGPDLRARGGSQDLRARGELAGPPTGFRAGGVEGGVTGASRSQPHPPSLVQTRLTGPAEAGIAAQQQLLQVTAYVPCPDGERMAILTLATIAVERAEHYRSLLRDIAHMVSFDSPPPDAPDEE